MSKKETSRSRPVHRIQLSLPIVKTDSYEIFCTTFPSQNLRSTSHLKPLVDNNKKNITQGTRVQCPLRCRPFTGSLFRNALVDTAQTTTESTSTLAHTISNSLMNSNNTNQTFRSVPQVVKRNKQKNIKDDSNHSRSSSGDRFLYESLASFDSYSINKVKYNSSMWKNIHHPQLTSTKTLHSRQPLKHMRTSNDTQTTIVNTRLLDNFSQESTTSTNEQLYEKIEKLTKNYFPIIRQIRHGRSHPELINNRIQLHYEQNQNFMPVLSRTRVVR